MSRVYYVGVLGHRHDSEFEIKVHLIYGDGSQFGQFYGENRQDGKYYYVEESVEAWCDNYDDYKYYRFETNMEKGLEKTIIFDFKQLGPVPMEAFISYEVMPDQSRYDFKITTDEMLQITPDSGDYYHTHGNYFMMVRPKRDPIVMVLEGFTHSVEFHFKIRYTKGGHIQHILQNRDVDLVTVNGFKQTLSLELEDLNSELKIYIENTQGTILLKTGFELTEVDKVDQNDYLQENWSNYGLVYYSIPKENLTCEGNDCMFYLGLKCSSSEDCSYTVKAV